MKACESCGMPIDQDSTSTFDNRYCIFCQDQNTGNLKSRIEVREGCIQAAIRFMGKTQKEAEKMADEQMPNLPRWKTQE